MYCYNCGSENEEGALFCGNCGFPIKNESVSKLNESVSKLNESVSKLNEKELAPIEHIILEELNDQDINMIVIDKEDLVIEKQENRETESYKPKRPLSKKKISLIGSLVIMAISLLIFFFVGRRSENYELLALNYFQTVQSCDWEGVYNSINIPEGEFLTKEMLIKAQSDSSPKTIWVYTINKTGDLNSKETLNDSGELNVAKMDEAKSDVYINYIITGETDINSYKVEVIKLKEKNMLFFNKYKVSPSNIALEKFNIRISNGAKVTIDGVEIEDKYLELSNDIYKNYVIDYIFEGKHTVKVTQENMEDYIQDIIVDDSDYLFTYLTPKMNKKITESFSILFTSAMNSMKKIYLAATNGEDYSTISTLFSDDLEIQTQVKEKYIKLMEQQLKAYAAGTTEIQWGGLSSSSNAQQISIKDNYPVVDLVINVKYKLINKNSTAITEKEDYTTCHFCYRYKDGKWGLYDVTLGVIG